MPLVHEKTDLCLRTNFFSKLRASHDADTLNACNIPFFVPFRSCLRMVAFAKLLTDRSRKFERIRLTLAI